ncbi:MAG TPA: tetratricopeptide repeat protein [Ignavibacteriaceae bacterium]|nr:tetratricopeptide repeat protein [Ignavibacteriaceae bacterium]
MRNIRKWVTIYVSTSLTILGTTQLFSFRYDLPSFIFNSVLITLISGFLVTLIISWFHGKEGPQRITFIEILFHLIIVILFFSTLYIVVLSPTEEINIEMQANSIAVLPFENMSDSKEDEYFSDGVTEDILTNLSKASGLKVISRTSVMKYKNTKKSIREIGKELGAETILEGSVRRVGNRVRITGQLIDAKNDTHIWSQYYDREMKDIFAIQSEIAEKIATALQANLLPLEKKMIETNNTQNIDAYTYYLKGRHLYYNFTDEDNNKAIDLFNKALEIDSNYALAYAGLADAYNQRVGKFGYSAELYDSSLALSEKALKLNPDLPEGYKAIGLTHDNLGKRELALVDYEKAIKLNPSFASAMLNYALIKLDLGKYDDSFYWLRKANTLEPDNVWVIMSIGNVYKYLLCDNLAIEWGKKAVSLDPENTFLQMLVGGMYLYAGKFDEAKTITAKAFDINNRLLLGWFFKSQIEAVLGNYKLSKKYLDNYMKQTGIDNPEYFYAHSLLKLNKKKEAMKILEDEKKEYVEYLRDYPDDASTTDYNALAEIYAILNEKDKAFEAWEKAIQEGWLDIRRNTLYPYFENLRDDPEYHRLLSLMQTKIAYLKTNIKKKYPMYEICE